MRPNVLLADIAIAIVAAIIILTVTPGLAVAGVLAIVVLTACAISFSRDSRRRSQARATRTRGGRPAGRAAAQSARRSKRT